MLMSLVGGAAFLITALGALVAAISLIYSLLVHRPDRARSILKWILIGLGSYFGMLLLVSFTSRERVLGLKEEKKFCGADCDLAFSVVNVTRTKTLGPPPQKNAAGIYYLVTVKVRSDAARVTMKPDHPEATVIDDQGKSYHYPSDGQQALASVQGQDAPFAQEIGPGAAYIKDLVFDLPAHVNNPCLIITEGAWITRLIIGDENSLFHKKTKIRLEPIEQQGQTAEVSKRR